MKNKKGISFVVLIATVAVMIILVSTVVITGTNTSNSAKKLSFATEINTLQVAVDSYANTNGGNLPVGDGVIINVANLSEEYKQQFTNNGETITNNNIVLAEIDYSKIGYETLKYGNGGDGQNDIYAVSPTTGKVYYAKGYKVGTNMYFTLTNELQNSLNYETSNLSISATPYVVFSTSQTNWTNKDVIINAKIPTDYEVDSITVDETNYTATQETVGGNKIYTIECSENSIINVKCHSTKLTSKTIEAKYSVKNIDKKAPTFTIVSQNKLENSDSVNGYLVINNVEDNLSGIKYIKYENNSAYDSRTLIDEQKYTITGHFNANGIDTISTTIPIEKSVRKISIYIEDNAGNWAIQTVDINL